MELSGGEWQEMKGSLSDFSVREMRRMFLDVITQLEANQLEENNCCEEEK